MASQIVLLTAASAVLLVLLAAVLVGVHQRARARRRASLETRRAVWESLPPREQHLVRTMEDLQTWLAEMSVQAHEHSLRIERLHLDAEVRSRRGDRTRHAARQGPEAQPGPEPEEGAPDA